MWRLENQFFTVILKQVLDLSCFTLIQFKQNISQLFPSIFPKFLLNLYCGGTVWYHGQTTAFKRVKNRSNSYMLKKGKFVLLKWSSSSSQGNENEEKTRNHFHFAQVSFCHHFPILCLHFVHLFSSWKRIKFFQMSFNGMSQHSLGRVGWVIFLKHFILPDLKLLPCLQSSV